ncbi:putative dienelactone hydrolase [Luteibacter rhizovicinus]|uniref:Putative dienelactone hydrolase n=1 Tax=Luteibacter rhizovicinus TaxID=242606 RepID=A0A4R3YVM3_9GAMM|nr:hypothetical protein [Luteibacter rhizovicinus]TCV95868.1 putative dienelactone hydrolase [Luteibacter rhizovicinus]
MRSYLCALVFAASIISTSQAAIVGEIHRTTTTPTAALRSAGHDATLRVTIWYPAATGAIEKPLEIGPPGNPLFVSGSAAADAAFAEGAHPVILLSHGFGGSARMMGWLGTELSRHGYVVVAVDHPGNNALGPMTAAGALLWWERAEDLKAALRVAESDPLAGPHIDRKRLGVAGFSAGGFTSLVAAGARVDVDRLVRFCNTHPTDGVCMPQKEAPELTSEAVKKASHEPAIAAQLRHAADDHSIPGIRAAFTIAPAIVQALDPASLRAIDIPVRIVLGNADVTAPPSTNGDVAATLLPHATLTALPDVTHYDFLGTCTQDGRKLVPLCALKRPQEDTHKKALDAAISFFDANI